MQASSDVVTTVTYFGTTQGGGQLVQTLQSCTSNCSIVANATVLSVAMQEGPKESVPPSVVTLEKIDTFAGDPYQFRTTYTFGDVLDPTPTTLTPQDLASMSCRKDESNGGVELFTCMPLKALPAVTLTAFGLLKRDPTQRVTASVTVLNTSELCSLMCVCIMQRTLLRCVFDRVCLVTIRT